MFDQPGEDASQPMSMEPVPQYKKQGFSVYTMMLLLSFLFLTTASILFFSYAG
jgi:cytoskeletal protein RodZ